MKRYLIALLPLILCVALNAQSPEKAYLTRSFSGEIISQVLSETSGGNIIVNAVSSSDSRVEVYVRQNGSWKNTATDEDIKKRVTEDYDLNVSVSNQKLTATAKSKHRITDWKKSLSFSFKIYVPQNATTDLRTSGGNIELTGMTGDKDFSTSGGNLVLNDLSGKTKGRTSGGNILLRNSKDDLDLTTSGGNIEAGNSSGDIKISTSGGSIKLNDLKGNIKAGTSGGNIKGAFIDGDLVANTSGGNISLQGLNCSLKTGTSGGNIDVSMKSLGKFVSIHNSAGKVNLQIPRNSGIDLKLSTMKISTGTMENFKGNMNKDEIDGVLNGGGVPVTVDAGGGKINLEFN